MRRIPEPELMEEVEQAEAYAAADFSEANGLFVELFRGLVGSEGFTGHAVDLGCGPADIPLQLAQAFPRARFDAVDGSEAMLACARARVRSAGRADRVRVFRVRIARDPLPRPRYDAVLSNSLLHHMQDPSALWEVVRACARTGAPVLVMDLMRPPDARAWEALVARYAGDAPQVLRRDFRNSLAAAFTREEVEAQLAAAGLGRLAVQAVSDRHLAVSGLA